MRAARFGIDCLFADYVGPANTGRTGTKLRLLWVDGTYRGQSAV
jgi:hypothetical protein